MAQSESVPARWPGRAPIEAYGAGGFRFAGMSHRGSIICLPSGIESWHARSSADLSSQSFSRFLDEQDRIETLLVGVGRTPIRLSTETLSLLRFAGMTVDAMDTGAACRTYNVLLAEERAVAAALIAVD